ncbi:uncharacterized protein [Rutidosis leptorrhynchoides]|uniref:uncharacterized protein n=1 Tax=Rutidosis leptorrhynchoides TaxID=125765 RepID=UPI003A98CF38
METNEDWELVNDDGFVYKRQKRQNLDSAVAAFSPPDPAAEAKARRERKKKTLLKLKTKYEQETHHWELLSNTLQALQDRTQNQSQLILLSVSDQTVNVLPRNPSDSTYQDRTDTLLAQVEDQEATISEISRLCDIAEKLCNVEEQRLKQSFLDLPIWDPSSKEVMTSLFEDEVLS